jgi:hypothetical protein
MPVSTEVRVHRMSGAAPPEWGERGWSNAAGFYDGLDQALDRKPPIRAANQCGDRFYGGWRSVRYPVGTEMAKG